MSILQFSNRWLNRLYKSIAICLVIFAVLISALRLLLPYAHNHKQDLQEYINTTYGSDLIIGSLDMGWQSSGPTLVATNVSLLQTDVTEVYIQAFDISIDFWASLRSRQIITKDFTLNGVKVLFDKTMLTQSKQDSNLVDNIAQLFLSQINQFSVKDSQVIVRTDIGERTFLINQLNWLNSGEHHQAKGDVILDGLTSNNLKIRLDLQGQQVEDMTGQLYLEANSLNITPWLDKILAIDDENTHSTINFRAWLAIESGTAQHLQLELADSQIAWQSRHLSQPNQMMDTVQTLKFGNGQVIFDNLANKKQINVYSSAIDIALNDNQWRPFTFELSSRGQQTHGYFSALDIAGISDLLPLLINEQDPLDLINGLNPTGEVNDLFIKYHDKTFAVVGQFNNIDSQYYQGFPGINNLDGQIVLDNTRIQVALSATDGALDFDKHFIAPIQYNVLTAALNLTLIPDGWQLNAEQIEFSSDELNVSATLAVADNKDQDITMSLLASASEGDAVFAQTFYPHLLMGQNLVDYLNAALVKGKLTQAQVLFNGPLSKFPFNDNEGIFVVDAELTDATFKFDSGWPAINHFNANLNFTNNEMLITGRSGSLSGIDVKGVTTAIADLTDEQVLQVDANFVDTSPELVTNLMNISPLAGSVGATLEQVVIDKTIAGQFNLTVPLNDNKLAVAKGRVNFNNNIVDLHTPEMHFTQVTGSLLFENDVLNTENLTVLWRDMPLSLTVDAKQQSNAYLTNIAIDGKWQQEDWLKQVPELLRPYAQGAIDWQGLLALTMYNDDEFSYDLSIHSNLADMAFNLPAPYAKQEKTQQMVEVNVRGNKSQSTVNALVGKQLNFYGVLDHSQVAFSQAHLVLGKEQMLLPMSGFHISTNLAQADFSQWQPFVKDIIDSLPSDDVTAHKLSNTPSLLAAPTRIRGEIAKLDILEQQLHDVSFNFQDEISWWLLEANAKEVRGEVKFYPDWHQQGVDINADFIRLSVKPQSDLSNEKLNEELVIANAINAEQNEALFNDLPPLRFRCADCSIDKLDLGKVTFDIIRKNEAEITLDNFIAQRRDNKLSFNVNWLQDGKQVLTTVGGEFSSKDIEHEIKQLGFPSTIKDSGFKTNFNFDWQASPLDFNLAQLNGNLTARLSEGVMDVDDKGARLLSIFSLKTLVRKLKLDFRDMFSDGMFFEELKGDFTVKNGVVYTKNTFMKGAAGDLTVKGNTDLNTEQLDYKMSYKPNVTSSLPAIAWIATLNPVTFLAGVALDGVITSQVVSEMKFEVTGDIFEPNLKKVDRKTQTITVGRDSPPQIVDNSLIPEKSIPTKASEIELDKPENPNEPDKSDG